MIGTKRGDGGTMSHVIVSQPIAALAVPSPHQCT